MRQTNGSICSTVNQSDHEFHEISAGQPTSINISHVTIYVILFWAETGSRYDISVNAQLLNIDIRAKGSFSYHTRGTP